MQDTETRKDDKADDAAPPAGAEDDASDSGAADSGAARKSASTRESAPSPEALVRRARDAQLAWSKLSVGERVKALGKARDRLLDRAVAIAKTVSQETGKPETEALLAEILGSADVFDYWCANIATMLEPTEVELDLLTYPGKEGEIERVARGVVLIISPWNFPVALPIRTIVPALLAGNAVVLKPSEVVPKSGEVIRDAFDGVGPEGLVTLAQGAGDVGAKLIDEDVDTVVFTGSVATGRKVAASCAERLIPCSLELGGKDAAIVLKDARLERAARGVAWGALTNAGQNCAAIERVYVEAPIFDAFKDELTRVVKELKKGDDVGPLATRAQLAIVRSHLEAATKDEGTKVLVGGGDADGNYQEPTVLVTSADAGPILEEETFGPLLPLVKVQSAEEAVRLANSSRFGLTASVWTKDVRRGKELARSLRAGVVTVNNHAFTGALPQAPWTGVGESGYGITNSPFALDALTRPRFVLVDRNRAKKELWWYPYTATLRQIALAFAALRSRSSGIGRKLGAIWTLLRALPKRLFTE